MAKRKAKSDVIVVHNVNDFVQRLEKLNQHIEEDTLPFKINQATVKDGFCHYQYTILHGVGAGDTHSVKGSGIVDKSLYEAFAALRVHLAIIDDAFNYSGIEIGDLSDVRAHSLTDNYTVTGFKFKGHKDSQSVVLQGTKYVSCAKDRINLETPPIPLDNLSSYKWHEDLRKAATEAHNEVAMYKEGKYTPVTELVIKNDNQKGLFDGDEVNKPDFEAAQA